MNKGAFDRECERRLVLMAQELALKERYKQQVRLLTEVKNENDQMERRILTWRRMIDELPDVKMVQRDTTDHSVMEDIQEIQMYSKPEVAYKDEIYLESMNEKYKVRADVKESITEYIKKREQMIKPFSVMYNFTQDTITREVYSTWGQKMRLIPIDAKIESTFMIRDNKYALPLVKVEDIKTENKIPIKQE